VRPDAATRGWAARLGLSRSAILTPPDRPCPCPGMKAAAVGVAWARTLPSLGARRNTKRAPLIAAPGWIPPHGFRPAARTCQLAPTIPQMRYAELGLDMPGSVARPDTATALYESQTLARQRLPPMWRKGLARAPSSQRPARVAVQERSPLPLPRRGLRVGRHYCATAPSHSNAEIVACEMVPRGTGRFASRHGPHQAAT